MTRPAALVSYFTNATTSGIHPRFTDLAFKGHEHLCRKGSWHSQRYWIGKSLQAQQAFAVGSHRTLQRTLRPEDPSKPELVGPTSVGERACVLVSNELEVSRGRINSNRVGFLSFCLVYRLVPTIR